MVLCKRRGFVLLLEASIVCIVMGLLAFGLAQSESSLFIATAADAKAVTARCIAEIRAALATSVEYESLEGLNGKSNIADSFQCVTVVGKEQKKAEVKFRIITISVNDRNSSGSKPVYRLTVMRAARNPAAAPFE